MRRVHPLPEVEITDVDFRTAYDFPGDTPRVRGSFVATLDGVMRGGDGTSRSIASAADRRVFSMLRAAADVILVGAGTVRDEDYRPSRHQVAIVSASLQLPLSLRIFADRSMDHPRPLIITTSQAREAAPTALTDVADLIACGTDDVNLSVALASLAERGLAKVHCEGGPRLLADMARAGLLDEVLLTVTPTLRGGGDADHVLPGNPLLDPAFSLELVHVLEEDGSVFIRARRPLAFGGAA